MELNETMFNRPSTAGGRLSVARLGGTDKNGEANVAQLSVNPSTSEVNKWTLQGSSTYTGGQYADRLHHP